MTAKALRAIRLALGLTIEQFSAMLRIPQDELDEMERGDRMINAARISRALERLAPDPPPDKT